MLRVLVISDTHVGSRWGLFPDKFRLSTGAKYTPNKGQRYLLRCWRAMQDDLAGDIDILILNGDIINGPNPKENARDQIEQDPDWQVRAAVELLTPLVARAGQVYATQGSPYHAGEGAQWGCGGPLGARGSKQPKKRLSNTPLEWRRGNASWNDAIHGGMEAGPYFFLFFGWLLEPGRDHCQKGLSPTKCTNFFWR